METLLELLTVAGLGALELWAAVPAGLGLDLHPVATAAAAALGAIVGVLVVTTLATRPRARLRRTRRLHGQKRARRLWERYGLPGLALLAPLLIGAPLGAALALAFGAPAGRLLLWSSLGIVLWSAALTAATALGLAGFESAS